MLTKEEQREKKRDRVQSARKPNSSEYRPPTVKADHIKADDYQRVAVYARVSTDNPEQTTSFELQQKFYTEMIDRYPKWTLTKIYADEGRSGVTVEHRPEFLQMIEDAKAGKFDLIITKSVSRLNRNTEQFLATVRTLSGYNVGVYFESENVYSLNQDLRMGMEMLAMMAAQESRNRSRSMESSLQMRLDHGLPLTPELLGFRKDDEGKLVVNEETKNIPKLMFYMCLFGYSTQQIADTLIKLSKKSYLGNIKWTSGGVVNSLRNERYAGDVLTRKRFKVFAADIGADGQKTFKNNGQKPQTYYHDDHDEIVSREDYLAVQRILDNTKYGGNCRLPSLRVVPEGLLKGFVIIHPHWSNFTKEDYILNFLNI